MAAHKGKDGAIRRSSLRDPERASYLELGGREAWRKAKKKMAKMEDRNFRQRKEINWNSDF